MNMRDAEVKIGFFNREKNFSLFIIVGALPLLLTISAVVVGAIASLATPQEIQSFFNIKINSFFGSNNLWFRSFISDLKDNLYLGPKDVIVSGGTASIPMWMALGCAVLTIVFSIIYVVVVKKDKIEEHRRFFKLSSGMFWFLNIILILGELTTITIPDWKTSQHPAYLAKMILDILCIATIALLVWSYYVWKYINWRLVKYIVKKLLFALVAYYIAITLVFIIYRVMPGDPTFIFATQRDVDPAVTQALIERWGLNEPLWNQYWIYLGNVLQGNLGYSYLHMKYVNEIIADFVPWSLLLLGTAFVLNSVIGIVLGAVVAWRRGSKLDSAFVLTYNVYNAIPLFFVGMIFIAVFGFMARDNGWLIYFPIFGSYSASFTGGGLMKFLDILWHMFLPLLVLVISGVLGWSWFMRGNLMNVKTEDYIQTAKAKGLNDNQVLFKHGFRNAALPVITSIGLSFGGLIGGALLIENVFAYKGMGTLIFGAIQNKDYQLLMGTFIIIAGITLLGLLIAEIFYGFVDPRIKAE
ncbi:MAG: ABC transporter permease [Candidatus Heimdallarchaeota archaeon]|nr:ABC transporter permease [Candidatus Heimdallarchaeota archaeon]